MFVSCLDCGKIFWVADASIRAGASPMCPRCFCREVDTGADELRRGGQRVYLTRQPRLRDDD